MSNKSDIDLPSKKYPHEKKPGYLGLCDPKLNMSAISEIEKDESFIRTLKVE